MTSHREQLPLAVLEAMACECPVVALDVPGPRDILSGSLSRFLLPADLDDAALAHGFLALLDEVREPAARARLRQHVVDHFSLDAMVNHYTELYLQLLRGEQNKAPTIKRAEAAANLWSYVEQTVRVGGRPRDALFAARAALRLHRGSVASWDHLRVLITAVTRSRLPSLSRRALSDVPRDERCVSYT
jgi:hypothetical protein